MLADYEVQELKNNFDIENLSPKDIDDKINRYNELYPEIYNIATGVFKCVKMLETKIKDKDRDIETL